MAVRKTGNVLMDAFVGAAADVLGRAIGAAAESVLEDVSDRLRSADEKVTRTKKKVSGVRGKRRKAPEVIEAEVVDESRKH